MKFFSDEKRGETYMKILVVSQYFWPENFRINDICLSLRKRHHDITVLTGLPNVPEGKFYKGYSWFKKGAREYNGIIKSFSAQAGHTPSPSAVT